MTDKPAWKEPVFIAQEQLVGPEPEVSSAPRARELPLDAVQVPHQETVALPTAAQRRPRGLTAAKLFAISLGTLLTLGVCVELYRLLDWSYAQHALLGGVVTTLSAGAVAAGAWWVKKSRSGLRQLTQARDLRHRGQALQGKSGQGAAAPYLKALQQHYQQSALAVPLNQAIHEIDSVYNDGEILRFIAQRALVDADEQAYRCITRHSLEAAVLVGVSPYATFDMLLVGWRNLRLLNEIAAIYGIAPGLPAQWTLIKQVLGNIAFAGISEMTIDASSTLLGSSLTSTLSARFGQGLGAGLITARIGLQTMHQCRPLPDPSTRRERLAAIQQRLIEEIKKLAEPQKSD